MKTFICKGARGAWLKGMEGGERMGDIVEIDNDLKNKRKN